MNMVLIDAEDQNVEYGILSVKGVGVEEVRQVIAGIIEQLNSECCSWNVGDITSKLPESWDWHLDPDIQYLEI